MDAASPLDALVAPGRALRRVGPRTQSALAANDPGAPYDRRAAAYDRIVGSRAYNRLVWGASIADYEAFAAEALVAGDGPLLDIGCGTLVFAAAAYRKTSRTIVLVDLSLGMLRRAADRLDDAPATLVQADVLDLPFSEKRFTTVASHAMLHVLDDPWTALAALHRQLAPGGRLFASMLVRDRAMGSAYLAALHRAGEIGPPRSCDELVGLLETFDRKLACGGEQGRMFPSQEVAMRPPEVFVRELSPEEGARLKSISKRARYQAKRQRAMVLLASSTGMSAPEIARLVRSDESRVRKVIHAFNEEGFDSLDPDYRGGRPKKTTPEQRDRIVAVARTRPDHRGVPLTRWSLPKLRAHLASMGVLLSEETLRQVLVGAGLSHQRTRSWKWSPDPDFADKAERVLSLYRAEPEDGVVVCFDEMGPIQLIPHHGSGWAPKKLPERLRATYSKKDGVRYLLGAYDVHADRLHGRLRAHKNAAEVLAFYRQIRMRYDPRLRIYLVADNLSTHKTAAIREWADKANVELVYTPTYASFLNRIECHFWGIGEFVIKNADYRDWDTLAKAMADHIRYRNGPHRDQRLINAERRLLIAA